MPETINLEMRGGDFCAIVESGGDGPPLLYLHGAVGQKGWAAFLERLSQQFTVYAPYIPGYGEATGLAHIADLTDLTLYHLALLDALGIERAHVVGHFLGGMIAADRNGRVLAAVGQPSGAGVARWRLARRRAGGRPARPQRRRVVGTPDRHARRRGVAGRRGRYAGPRPDAGHCRRREVPLAPADRGLHRRAYRIKAPTLILWGEQDRINPPSYAADFKGLIAASQTGTVANAGHLLMLEQPDAFAGAITAFLTEGD